MATTTSQLAEFKQFFEAQIAAGHDDVSPEELVQLWRRHRGELTESVECVRRALQNLSAGERGRPLDEFVEDFRTRRGISRDS